MLHPVLVSMLTVELRGPRCEDIMCPEGSAAVLTSLLSSSLFHSVVVIYCSWQLIMYVRKRHWDRISFVLLYICRGYNQPTSFFLIIPASHFQRHESCKYFLTIKLCKLPETIKQQQRITAGSFFLFTFLKQFVSFCFQEGTVWD